MKKIGIIIGIVWLALSAGCERQEKTPATPAIKIGGIYWPGSYWIDLADRKGFFREAGLNVSVINVDADYIGAFDDLAEGKIDSLTLPFFDFVRLNAEGHPIVGTIVTDYSSGAEAIIAKPGIGTFKELKGKRVGLKRNTYAEYIFTVVAERNSLPMEDVEIVDIQAEAVAEELIKGNVDAIFAWEPLLTQALVEVPGSKVVFSTSEIPGIAGGVQCFRRDFVRSRPEEMQKIVEVWARATEYMNQHPDEVFAIIGAIYDRPADEVGKFLKVDRILESRENELAFSFAAGFDSIHGAARQMNDFMLDRGMTKTKLDTSQIVDPNFVRGLQK